MTQPSDSSHPPTSSLHTYTATALGRRSTLFQVAAGLGIAGFSIGLLIFLAACFGFGAAMVLSPLPLLMGGVGLVLTIIGGVLDPQIDGSQVAASLFINVGAIAGGLLELAAWRGWQIFA